jgi:DNA-binding transcriptional MerR regulator
MPAMKTLPQIPLDFIEQEKENGASAEPLNIRVRLKSLKTAHDQTISTVSPENKSRRGRRPLKQLEQEAELVEVPEDEVLFRKQYYTIGEVAKMFNANPSLIRTWENEFDVIEPRKNRKGDRYFRPVDIKNLLLIHQLIRKQKYTLEGAKDYMKKNKKAAERFAMIQSLQKIKSFLLEVKANL